MANWKHPPLVMSGLVLGLFALGNLLEGYWHPLRWLLGSLAFCLYLLLIIGIIRYPQKAREQLQQPLVSSVFPTFFMSGMVFATYLQQLFGLDGVASILWWASLLGNSAFILLFFLKFTWRFRWDFVFPSWSVLYVGIAVAGLSVSVTKAYAIGQIVFWYGLIATGCVLPLMAVRAYRIGLNEATRPNISTFCAPVSLLLASYLNTITPFANKTLVWFLLVASQVLYWFVLLQLPGLLNRPFNPGFSAFTFPFVISATSLKLALSYLGASSIWQLLVWFEVGIAIFLVLFVLSHYLLFLKQDHS